MASSIKSITLTPLASGSKGNLSLLTWNENFHALIDCGLTVKNVKKLLQEQGVEPTQLSAIIVTHEHADHIRGVGPLARKYNLPVYLSAGTQKTYNLEHVAIRTFSIHEPFEIEGLMVCPFPIPHDARETCAFTMHLVDHPTKRMGYLTDCGHITPFVVEKLKGVEVLALEANHCPDMLSVGPYPPSLKQRVGGAYGHLSNQQAADLLKHIHPTLKDIRLMHMSEKNNTIEEALKVCRTQVPEHIPMSVAAQHTFSERLVLKIEE